MDKPAIERTTDAPPGPTDALALLAEPTRRRLYDLVAGALEPIGRDDAAAALGISRELSAFHLDRLVEAGLLEASYRRRGERRGPGAGRPAKLYRRVEREVTLSLPPRDYERAAHVFATAFDHLGRRTRGSVRREVDGLAHEAGVATGSAARSRAEQVGTGRDALVGLMRVAGYEPRPAAPGSQDGPVGIELGNCPYRTLSAAHRDLTCGMNLAWAEGVVEGLGDWTLTAEAVTDPPPGRCCVRFVVADAPEAGTA